MPSSPKTVSTVQKVCAYGLGTFFFLYAFIQRVSPSVMTEDLMQEFSISAAGVGVLSSMYFYTYASMQLPVGMLVDRFGPRKLMAVAALICVAASLWFASSTTLFTASVSRAMIGGAVAFPFVCTLAIAATFFHPKRFAMLTGLLLAIGMVGAIAGQAPLRLLIEITHWRTTYHLLAAIALVLAVLLFIVVPRRPEKTVSEPRKDSSMFKGFSAVCSNRQSWWSAGVGFGLTTVMLAFAGLWAVPWLSSTRGFSATQSGAVASSLFLGMMIGSPVMGYVSDAVQKRRPILLGGSIICFITIGFIIYGNSQSAAGLSALFFIYGLGASCMVTCFGLTREWNKPENSATALGLVNMCVVGSGAVMQPMIGWLLDLSWDGTLSNNTRSYDATDYQIALSSLLFTTGFAVICATLVKETHCQQQA